jgi:hypothetical protein
MVFISGGNPFRNNARPQRYQTPHAETGSGVKTPAEASEPVGIEDKIGSARLYLNKLLRPAGHPSLAIFSYHFGEASKSIQ